MPVLDGLRALAAVGVVLYHVTTTFGRWGLVERGYLLVDLFFMLSGFVLAMAFDRRFAAGLSFARFMKARIMRLWPLMAMGVALGVVCHFAARGTLFSVRDVALGLLILPRLSGEGQLFVVDPPEWSLLFELIANAVHVLILWRLSDRLLLLLALLAGAALTVSVAMIGSNGAGPDVYGWWLGLLRVMFAYPIGMLLARRSVRRGANSGLGWQVSLLLPVAIVAFSPLLPLSRGLGDVILTLLAFPLVMWLAAAPSRGEPAALLMAMGRLSYPLYVFHYPLLLCGKAVSDRVPETFAPLVAAASVTISLVLAHCAARLLERGKQPKPMGDHDGHSPGLALNA
ncbi:acyltransferase [Novosphingobium flavum]|uniref:Acyltransferase n=1 Tax=Novosphingobium flavum TaxID=1778672 RepID=A0A7X1FNR0_9SPHN|nr:acyltransferase [Novosphingobium flavum]MBC2664149.1 acyltransferase [Novosphingobium flavum]